MKVVLDTNTLVSAIGWEGAPRRVVLMIREGRHALVTSTALLAELARILAHRKLRRVATHPLLPSILEWVHRPEHLVVPQERVQAIEADTADNAVLEAAIEGHADVIVSGDRHLLDIGEFRGIPIVTAATFAARHR